MLFKSQDDFSGSQNLFWLAGIVFMVAAVFLVLVLYSWMAGPKELEKHKSWEVDEVSLIEWMEKSVEAEQAFERAWLADPTDPDVFKQLDEAILYQFKLRAMDPEDSFGAAGRLEKLLKRLENTKGKSLYSKVRVNVEKANDLIARGDSVSALPLLEEAVEAQDWINNHLHGSSLVDLTEVARIQQSIKSLRTVDSAGEVDRFYNEGKAAYAAGRWEEATRLYNRAIVLQESINLNMPESSYVRWRLVQELREQLRRIGAAQMNERIGELIDASHIERKSENLERALKLQELVNERFPNTEFFNPDRVKSLRGQLASDLSAANVALLTEQVDLLNDHLKNQRWESASDALLELEGSLGEFETRFSLSLLPDPSLKDRVNWLVQLEDGIEALADQIYARLVAHPVRDLRIFSSEVDQGLYERIMNENPSRWTGLGYPVDSVSFEEALEFCKRTGWLLGRPVVLPELIWLTSILEGQQVREEQFWLSGNSQFRSQTVGSSTPVSGFYDLYGNLEEWTNPVDRAHELILFGGSGADSWNKITENPVNRVAPNFRSRWAGFRFCVLE